MKAAHTISHRRINITLPVDTARLVDRVAAKGNRSRVIAEAIRHYIGTSSRIELEKRLREGAAKRADRDRALVEEWFSVDEEVWHRRGK